MPSRSIINSIRHSLIIQPDAPSNNPQEDHKITLRDNTTSRVDSEEAGSGDSRRCSTDGARATLRTAIARRKYSKWPAGAVDVAGVGKKSGAQNASGGMACFGGGVGGMPGVVVRTQEGGPAGGLGGGGCGGRSGGGVDSGVSGMGENSGPSKNKTWGRGTESVTLQVEDESDTSQSNGKVVGPGQGGREMAMADRGGSQTDIGSVMAPTEDSASISAYSQYLRPKSRQKKMPRIKKAEIEVLYENQRGYVARKRGFLA